MSKYRSYKFVVKNTGTTKLNVVKIFIIATILFLIIRHFNTLVIKLPETFSKLFTIEKIIVVKNNTTLSDEILQQHFSTPKTIFSLYKSTKSLKKRYPEIKELTITGLPFKTIMINMSAEIPFCYTKLANGEIKFFSKTKGWYNVYDTSKIKLEELMEFQSDFDDTYSIDTVENIYQKFYKAGLTKKIDKIVANKNGEFRLIMKNTKCEQEIVIDDSITSIDNEEIAKFMSYVNTNDGKIYARLIKEGRIYVEQD